MKDKSFDCVQVKNEIQEKLLKEMHGLTLEQRRAGFGKRVLTDPVLGPLWRESRGAGISGLLYPGAVAS